ncbi:hypothetical protein G9A89_018491 [Geosiphon pyriformis]|nr:hypothetical protein G9A89_018491 [Geosiphon pyriformis]
MNKSGSMSIFRYFTGQTGKPSTSESWNNGSEKYFGLENFGNTCYCNSILQALYFCKPFRECVINFPNSPATIAANSPLSPTVTSPSPSINGLMFRKENNSTLDIKVNGDNSLNSVPGMEDTLFGALKDLFWKISIQKKKTGVVAPGQFVTKLKEKNELFRSTMHQDAHEFLNYILNDIAENVLEQKRRMEEAEIQQAELNEKQKDSFNGANSQEREKRSSTDKNSVKTSSTSTSNSPKMTWVHQLFQGFYTNETKCLTCETVTSKDEPFLDLSIDIEQNSSVTSCLRQFSASEMLCHNNKFFCDVCCGLQEAEKRIRIKELPNVLALHLKRFKYDNSLKYNKLSYRVVFPTELRLFNTCDEIQDPDRLYELFAICVHIGSGPYHGHYVTLIKSLGQWLLFDDDNVEPVDETEIHKYFGDLPGNGSGYVLFYQASDIDLSTLGLGNTTWAQSVASSSSSGEHELSTEAIEISSRDYITPTIVNGTTENESINSSTTTIVTSEEPRTERLPSIRENSSSFAEWPAALLSRRKKEHNTSDRRKSHGDHELSSKDKENKDNKDNKDSKDNESNNDNSLQIEKPISEKEKTSWFGSGRSKSLSHKDKHKDKDREKEKDRDKDKEKEKEKEKDKEKEKEKEEKEHKKSASTPLETIIPEPTGLSNSKRDKKAEKEAKKLEKKNKNFEKHPKLTVNTNGVHEKAVSM